MYKWNMSYDDGAMPIIEEQLKLMQFDLHQPFFLFIPVRHHTLSRFALYDSLHLVEGHLVDDRRDKVFVSESFFPVNNSLRVAPVFLYSGLKCRADCGIIGNIINVRECSHKSEFVVRDEYVV